jgi:hypothetical protein
MSAVTLADYIPCPRQSHAYPTGRPILGRPGAGVLGQRPERTENMRRHQGSRKRLFSPAQASDSGFLDKLVQLLHTVTVEHQTRWHHRAGRPPRRPGRASKCGDMPGLADSGRLQYLGPIWHGAATGGGRYKPSVP